MYIYTYTYTYTYIHIYTPGYVALLIDRLAIHTAAGRPVSGSLRSARVSKETYLSSKRALITLAYLRYA